MNEPSFSPAALQVDKVGRFLNRLTKGLLVLLVTLLPLFFVPGFTMLTGIMKVYFVLALTLVALVCYCFYVLRKGSLSLRFSPLLLAGWGLVVATTVSALLAPQVGIALFGDVIGVYTVGFLALGMTLMTMMMVFKDSKSAIVYLYAGLLLSALVLCLLHLARLLFGADFLAFGFLNDPAATLVGSFNDLALFLAMVVIVSLISLLQLSLPKLLQGILATVVVVSLLMLGVINFFTVWLVLGLFGLLMFIYALTKGRINTQNYSRPTSGLALALSGLVFVVAIVFLVGGASLGNYISSKTQISYLEVRPSVSATLDILKSVYQENAFTGAGPNHFNEAWTKYKDVSINETVFWNTPFSSGYGYALTWFVTGGLISVFAWLVFMGLFLWQGVRTLLREVNNKFWYFIGTVSFATALFVWGMTIVYTPGVVIILLGFVSTGLFIIASDVLLGRPEKSLNLLSNSRSGFLMITLVMLVIIGVVAVGYQSSKQVMSVVTFSEAIAIPGDTKDGIVTITGLVDQALNYHKNDAFARDLSSYQLQEVQKLASIAEPTADDIQLSNALVQASVSASTRAIAIRGTDARNWSARGDIYTTLTNLEGAGDTYYVRGMEDYKMAKDRDPNNPYYDLQIAKLEISQKKEEAARAALKQALTLKPNYTPALIFLSQLDIATGNIDQAIATTLSLLALENNNPGRLYQLGLLYIAKTDNQSALQALTEAIKLNPQYANAIYMRALVLLKLKEKEQALAELKIVRDLNEDNHSLDDLIGQIERDELTADNLKLIGDNESVSEPTQVSSGDTVTTTDTNTDTDLISPVNTVPTNTSSSTEAR